MKSTNLSFTYKLVIISIFLITFGGVLFTFDTPIMALLKQSESFKYLIEYKEFWQTHVHSWLGDIITFIGVMLALSLPFLAQMIQGVISTYGLSDFSKITEKNLKVTRLQTLLFFFIGFVIFWRLFVFNITPTPFAQLSFIAIDLSIASIFLYILYRLYQLIKYILNCTFDFYATIIEPSINAIYDIYQANTDKIKPYNNDYLSNVNTIKDYIINGLRKGIPIEVEINRFDKKVWEYIDSLLKDNDSAKYGIELHKELSTIISIICRVAGQEKYSYYVDLVESLSHQTLFKVLDYISYENDPNWNLRNGYFSDLYSLAKEVEIEHANDFAPILSGHFLMSYSSIIMKNVYFPTDQHFNKNQYIDYLDKLSNCINEVFIFLKNIINILEANKLNMQLIDLYKNIRNDTQFPTKNNVNLFNFVNLNQRDSDLYRKINKLHKNITLKNIDEKMKYFLDFAYSDDSVHIINDQQIKEVLSELTSIKYNLQAKILITYWLKAVSFDTNIIITILEVANPLESTRLQDVGEHLIPTTIEDIFKSYLNVYQIDFEDFNPLLTDDRKDYNISFQTLLLHHFARFFISDNSINSDNAATRTQNYIQRKVDELYSIPNLSLRDLRNIIQISKDWLNFQVGLNNNAGIVTLCSKFNIVYNDLKEIYLDFLAKVIESAEEKEQFMISNSPLNGTLKILIDEISENQSKAFQCMKERFENQNISYESMPPEAIQSNVFNINKEAFIDDTGIHYSLDNIGSEYGSILKSYMKKNLDKILIISKEHKDQPIECTHKKEGNMIKISSKYYFYFKEKNSGNS